MKCNHCNSEISEGSNFCEYCGASLLKRKDKNLLWNKLTTVLSLCVIALGVAFCYEVVQYTSAKEKLEATKDASCQEPEKPVATTDGYSMNNGNDIDGIALQRDSLLLEVNTLQEENKKLRRKVVELDEENGYLTTDVRLAKEALEDCMRK